MKITKKQQRSTKAIAAVMLTMFYCINVQSVRDDVPKQMARNDELHTEWSELNESIRSI
ncbi:MAG: hypothetical protein NAG76_22605 [Candidatus Pristimantibacillus lignocellulolyticus]|uniref:Uncharacterized protein n=1 Tax=Candidatus Pristimantibacillus lignocellulolyticus TaxID=2994561 RepID=A0A9J6ZEH6_9BACL|nr:MAG: hypothetical protein NAG76_22605 [Candidatus Pristimantibacillus lignocellulolyticus]